MPTDAIRSETMSWASALLLRVTSRATTTAPIGRPWSTIGPRLHEYQASVAVGAGPRVSQVWASPVANPASSALVIASWASPGTNSSHDRPRT